MTPEEIGKRFAAHPRWQWMTGMKMIDPDGDYEDPEDPPVLLVVDASHDSAMLLALDCDSWECEWDSVRGCYPDLTDPVTVMACLVWLRAESDLPKLHLCPALVGRTTWWWKLCDESGPPLLLRPTMAGAILAGAEMLLW